LLPFETATPRPGQSLAVNPPPGPPDWPPFGLSVPTGAPGRRLQPIPITSVFEIGVRILRRHFGVLMLLAVVFELAPGLLTAAAGVRMGDALISAFPGLTTGQVATPRLSDAQTQGLVDAGLFSLGASLLAGLLTGIATVGYSWVVGRDYHAARPSVGSAVLATLRRAMPAIAVVLVTTLVLFGVILAGGLLMAGALVLVGPADPARGGAGVFLALVALVATAVIALTLAVRLSLGVQSVALEEVGAVHGLARSWHLTASNTWRTFGVIAIASIVTSILATAITQLLGAVLVDGFATGIGYAVVGETAVSAVAALLFAPVSPVVQSVLYYDLRVRRDAWDLPAPGTLDPALED
jgi:hypothetical protein